MIALEKLLLLKSVTLFKETPDDLLMQVASSIAEEQMVKAGELIIQKDDTGTTMYVIVNGRVRVHDGDIFITELGEHEIFGELSALSLQTRVSSVSAISDCLLLKINSSDLYDLMNFDTGLAKGIIQSLCHRARTMSLQMQEILHQNRK